MIKIESVNNEKIKEILKLKQKKYRDEKGLILVEGYKIFEEIVKADLNIKNIILTNEVFEKLNLNKFLDKIIIVSSKIAEKLSFQMSSTNFFVVVEKPKEKFYGGNIAILDNIQDPQNLGAIVRTSVATNIKDIYTLNSVDEYNDKTIRASMGNIFKVNIHHIQVCDLKEICKDKTVYSANMNGENVFKISKPQNAFAIILGNEGNGVSKEVEEFANKVIAIPMQNEVESLNVAVSFSIIAYHLTNFS